MWITYRPTADAPVGLLNLDRVCLVRLAPYGTRARAVAVFPNGSHADLFDGPADDAAAYLDRLADLVRAGAAVRLPRDNPTPPPVALHLDWTDGGMGEVEAAMPDGRLLTVGPNGDGGWCWTVQEWTDGSVITVDGDAPTPDRAKTAAYDAWKALQGAPVTPPAAVPPAPDWQDHFDGGSLADMPDGRLLVATPTDGTWWRWAVSTPDGVYLTSGRAPTFDSAKRRAHDAWQTLQPTPADDDDALIDWTVRVEKDADGNTTFVADSTRCSSCGQVGVDLTGNDAYCDAITTAHGDLVLMSDDTAGGALQCLPCNEKRLSQ